MQGRVAGTGKVCSQSLEAEICLVQGEEKKKEYFLVKVRLE